MRGLVGPCVLLTPLAYETLWFSAKVACPPLLLRKPLPDSRALPFLSAPSPHGGQHLHALGVGSRPSHWGNSPLCHALCASKAPPPWSGPQVSFSLWSAPHPSRTEPELLGPGQGCPGTLRPWPGGRTSPIQSQARTQPPEPCTHGPHSVSLETGKALLRK